MQWRHPHHTWWLAACLLGLLISTWLGGFSLALASMIVIVFGVGASLIRAD